MLPGTPIVMGIYQGKGGGMASRMKPPEEPQDGDSSQTEDGPKPKQSPQTEESPQTGHGRQGEEDTERSARDRRRGRSGSVVAWLSIAGALLVLRDSSKSVLRCVNDRGV
jgi:hypothetical protein